MIPVNNDIRIEVTTRCNYNCLICTRDKLTRGIETMSFDLYKKLLDKIMLETAQYDNVSFPGMGEPLMDETLDEKIAYAVGKGFSVMLLTNGYFLDARRFQQFEALGVASVRVSFYGTDAENYNRAHGIKDPRVFYRIRDNLLEIARRKKRTKLLLTFNVIPGANDDAVDSWIKFWQEKTDLIEVWRPHNWCDGKDYRLVQPDKAMTCGRPFNGPLQIQSDGTVNMCCFDFDGKLTLGDLKTQSLREIFSAPFYNKIRECHQEGSFAASGLICENCDQRNKDKRGVCVYNSRFDLRERAGMTSTTYEKMIQGNNA